MAGNNIHAKAEAALFALIAAQQSSMPSVLIKKGMQDGEIAEPCIIVECTGATSDPQLGQTGVWRVDCQITVRTSPDEFISADFGNANSETQSERTGIVFDALMDTTAPATLSAAVSDFSILGGASDCDFGIIFNSLNQEIRERGWGSTLSFTLVCCGLDLT